MCFDYLYGENKEMIDLEMNEIERKGIKIAVIPSGTKWQIELSLNNNIHLDSKIYEAKEAYEKMYEYYKYYYDKHNI